MCLFTTSNFVVCCESHGVDAVAVFPDSQAIIENMGGVSGPFVEDGRTSPTLHRWKVCETEWLQKNPGVCTPPLEALEAFQPLVVLVTFSCFSLGMRYERSSGVPAVPLYFSEAVVELFGDTMDLEPRRPAFLAVSPIVASGLAKVQVTGEWSLEEALPQDLEGGCLAHLRQFLADGERPICVTWGSMIPKGMSPENCLKLALRAVKEAGCRAVIIGGWCRLDEIADRVLASDAELATVASEVCFVPSISHSWLFPKCSCVVHHGGCGTTHTALRAGRPAVVTPVFGDQFDFSASVERLGVGVGFSKSLVNVTPRQLATAILQSKERHSAAELLGRQIRHRSGKMMAATILDSFIKRRIESGAWQREFEEHAEKLSSAVQRSKARRGA